jgi:hypothetical protein
MKWHPVLVILWFMFWPVSEIAGLPEGADKDISLAKLGKLTGIAICVSLVFYLIFFV